MHSEDRKLIIVIHHELHRIARARNSIGERESRGPLSDAVRVRAARRETVRAGKASGVSRYRGDGVRSLAVCGHRQRFTQFNLAAHRQTTSEDRAIHHARGTIVRD